MLLAVDIGNSRIKFGLFDGDFLHKKTSIPTDRDYTAEQFRLAVGDDLTASVSSAIACSVVPQLNASVAEFVKSAYGIKTVIVGNHFNFGLKIKYEPLESLGTDRLVNAFAATTKYGKPCIVCSLGTATTIDAVSADGEFLGGVIAPGIQAMADALYVKAAQLPHVVIGKPKVVIGTSTEEAISAGVFYGYIGMLKGLVERIAGEVGEHVMVIATGGSAQLFAVEIDTIRIVDEHLTLHGLNQLFRRIQNRPR